MRLFKNFWVDGVAQASQAWGPEYNP
jgi:hypothetical protein